MRGRGVATTNRIDRARSAWVRLSTPLAVALATLALIAQTLAPPVHLMRAPAEVARVAADLKATFGDQAVLCIQADADGAPPTPAAPSAPCDDCCPLCQFHAGAHAFILPPLRGPPMRIEAASETLAAAPDFVRPKTYRTAFAQPRAPPVEA